MHTIENGVCIEKKLNNVRFCLKPCYVNRSPHVSRFCVRFPDFRPKSENLTISRFTKSFGCRMGCLIYGDTLAEAVEFSFVPMFVLIKFSQAQNSFSIRLIISHSGQQIFVNCLLVLPYHLETSRHISQTFSNYLSRRFKC